MSKRIQILSFVLALSFMVAIFGACGSGEKKSAVSTESTAQSQATQEPEKNYDPFAKYEEPVTVTAVIKADPTTDPKVPKDTTPETQLFVKYAKEKYNIDLKFLWQVPTSQYDQKFSVTLASGELPDFMELSAIQYENLKENEQLADLTEAMNYASPRLKELLSRDPKVLETITEDGKLYGIPQYYDPRRDLNMFWIRQDWLTNVGLGVPTTMDELKNVAKAFIENDPDKNGQKDTYGITLTNKIDFWGWPVKHWLQSFGSYPKAWIKGADGQLVAGEILPETRNALEYLQNCYKEGLIDKEFAMKDWEKVQQDIVAGKIGMTYGQWWYYEWPMNTSKDKTPEANWVCTAIPTTNGNVGKAAIDTMTFGNYNVVSNKSKNPDAVIKLFNLWCMMEDGEFGSRDSLSEQGYVWSWVPTKFFDPFDINTAYEKLNAAIDNNDTELKNFSENEKITLTKYKDYLQFKEGKVQWSGDNFGGAMARLDKDGGWGTTRKIVESGNVVRNEYFGPATAAMQEKGAALDKLTEETFLKIIMNAAPVSNFDKYVVDWKALGGDEITKEVNDWYAKINK